MLSFSCPENSDIKGEVVLIVFKEEPARFGVYPGNLILKDSSGKEHLIKYSTEGIYPLVGNFYNFVFDCESNSYTVTNFEGELVQS